MMCLAEAVQLSASHVMVHLVIYSSGIIKVQELLARWVLGITFH